MLAKRLRVLFETSRPISWVNTAYPFAAGYLMLGGQIDWYFWVAVVFFLIPYNLLMYGINDVFDYESDMRNPRKGGVEGAVTPKRYHALILHASIWGSLPFVLALMIGGTLVSTLVLIGVLWFVVAYSAKGLRFKEVPLLDSITSSLHFVGPLLFAYTLVPSVPGAAWIIAAAFFLWGIASQAFGAVQDIVPDREAGIRSVATIIGARSTVTLAWILYIASSILLVSLGNLWALIVALASLAYVLNVTPFLTIRDANSGIARQGWRRFLWINYFVGAVVTMVLMAMTL